MKGRGCSWLNFGMKYSTGRPFQSDFICLTAYLFRHSFMSPRFVVFRSAERI